MSFYPTVIPDDTNYPDRTDDVDWIYAARYNEIKNEVIALCKELGISPSGASATLVARLALLALKSNVLEKDNTTAFTPDTDYKPATKKYVDDNAYGLKYPAFVYDVEGNKYCTVLIGQQLWMAQNLRVEQDPAGGAITSYLYTGADEEKEGRLYTWDDMMNGDGEGGQGLAPDGWHIPTDAEFKELERYLGMKQSQVDALEWRGVNEGKMLKSLDPVAAVASNGLNTFGFNALLTGNRNTDSNYYSRGTRTYLWSSTVGTTGAWLRRLYSTESNVARYDYDKANGFSVRCLKD